MADVYQMVTDRIIEQLETGTIPWVKPWVGGKSLAISRVTGKPYSLLNQILINCSGGSATEYLTYQQALKEGSHVKRGERGHMVVFFKPYEKVDPDTGEVTRHFYLRNYTVFGIDQCEGLKPRFAVSIQKLQNNDLKPDEKVEHAESILRSYMDREHIKLEVEESDQAYYSPSTDTIHLPNKSQFISPVHAVACLAHEAAHSSGHSSRLNRLHDIAAFGDSSYSKEELISEMSSAMFLNLCGIETPETFQNSASYIAGWLSALRNDKRLVVSAASASEKAVNFILHGKEETHDVEPCDGSEAD